MYRAAHRVSALTRHRRARSPFPLKPIRASPLRTRLAACPAPPGASLAPARRNSIRHRPAARHSANGIASSRSPLRGLALSDAQSPAHPAMCVALHDPALRAPVVRAPLNIVTCRRFGPVLRTVAECLRPCPVSNRTGPRPRLAVLRTTSPNRARCYAASLPWPASPPPSSCRPWPSVATLQCRPRSTLASVNAFQVRPILEPSGTDDRHDGPARRSTMRSRSTQRPHSRPTDQRIPSRRIVPLRPPAGLRSIQRFCCKIRAFLPNSLARFARTGQLSPHGLPRPIP